jgi:DNA-binding NarL/FixJ family response regulator
MDIIAKNNLIKIVIADDHELFRDGFKLMLKKQSNLTVLDEAVNGKQLVEKVKVLQPDVIITDIKMPIMDGLEATKAITTKYPNIGVIALSMFDDDDLIVDMLEAGAKGYLLKNADKEQIVEAIETVYLGNPYYCKNTSNKLAKMIVQSSFNPYKQKEKLAYTPKELQLTQLICEGLTTKEIAESMFTSIRTVEGVRAKLLEKMGVSNSVGVVIYAVKNGLVKM